MLPLHSCPKSPPNQDNRAMMAAEWVRASSSPSCSWRSSCRSRSCGRGGASRNQARSAASCRRRRPVRLTSNALRSARVAAVAGRLRDRPDRLDGVEHVLIGPAGIFAVVTSMDPLPAPVADRRSTRSRRRGDHARRARRRAAAVRDDRAIVSSPSTGAPTSAGARRSASSCCPASPPSTVVDRATGRTCRSGTRRCRFPRPRSTSPGRPS